ncbi:Ribulose-5-phosphate 4-epimerase [Caenispirillum salinarum AK4]|uniref:Ribulose-5-phosphate 4-epimerase n=1 Tax=Caenispirillum salinarum AK4 TaxID=1238182 RepID=K9GKU3_9PROT|nr:class II aldolase/adducin family protein [Caenispirillum salinarum]EKV26620.1 Ribulose-5-phosphate 4-epimerase [Caenispirillum salinarum AK4]
MTILALRNQLVDLSTALVRKGLNRGTAGNASIRVDDDSFLVTPSGVEPHAMKPADTVMMEMDGRFRGERAPSSEWRFHRDILAAREDVGCVIHTHAPFCTTLACLGRGIPSFHYMVAAAGGHDVRCAPYATFGTQGLSDHALEALEGRRACLLAHHGMIVTGETWQKALKLAVELEELAEQYWRILQVEPNPPLLDAAEMDRVLEKFKTYGRPIEADEDGQRTAAE